LVVRLGGLSGVSWEVDIRCSEAVVSCLAVVERGVGIAAVMMSIGVEREACLRIDVQGPLPTKVLQLLPFSVL
jgi:hypothetical protein